MGSRSRSRSPRERVDRFGRTITRSKSRSRSRSGSRSRSRSRDRFRRRSRSPSNSYFGRERGRDAYSMDRRRSSLNPRTEVTDRTNIEDPEYLNARLFIGNLASDRTTKQDLENLFQSYGKILGKCHSRSLTYHIIY